MDLRTGEIVTYAVEWIDATTLELRCECTDSGQPWAVDVTTGQLGVLP